MFTLARKISTPAHSDTGTRLEIVVIDQDTDRRSPPISVDDWRAPVLEIGPGSSTARSGGSSGSSSSGWKREGRLPLPADFRTPGAVLVRKLATAEGDSSVDFIGTIKLVRCVHPGAWVRGWLPRLAAGWCRARVVR